QGGNRNPGHSSGGTSDGTVYDCPGNADNPNCPPASALPPQSHGDTFDGTGPSGSSNGSTNGQRSGGTSGGASGGTSGSGGTSDGTTNGTGNSGNNAGGTGANGSTGTSGHTSDGVPPECTYVSDLSYCSSNSSCADGNCTSG